MSAEQEHKPTIYSPANIVTVARILLIPLFLVVLLSPWPSWFSAPSWVSVIQPWAAAAVFALISCTDFIDGYLARSRNEVTTFGKFLDPLADKILVAAALLALVQLGTLPAWIALVILSREFIVSGLRMVASAEGTVIAASWYGKAKTMFQLIAIIMFLIKDSPVLVRILGGTGAYWFRGVSWAVMIIAVVLTILSMIDYFARAGKSLSGPWDE